MIFAVIGDIKGNFSACNAVLDALEDEGIHTIFQTGNLFLGGEEGDALLELLRERGVQYVQGEEERLLCRYEKKQEGLAQRLEKDEIACIERTLAGISSRNIEVLRSLPHLRQVIVEGISIALCHGSPSSQRKVLDENTPPMRLQREREIVSADILIAGGATTAYHRYVAETLVLCPGHCVVAQASPPASAQYTLVNTEEKPWTVETFSVEW